MYMKMIVIALCAFIFWIQACDAEQENIIPDNSYMIRSIKVEGVWLPDYRPPFDLPVAYSYKNISEAMRKAKQDFNATEERFNKLFRGQYMSMKLLRPIYHIKDKNVDVTLHIIHLGIKQVRVGDRTFQYPVLPIPRLLNDIPDQILKYAPRVGMTTDRKYGIAPSFGFSINGSDLTDSLKKHTLQNFILQMDGRRSIEEDYYDLQGIAYFKKPVVNDFLTDVSFYTSINSEKSPKINSQIDSFSISVGSKLYIQHNLGWINKAVIDAACSFSDNDFDFGNNAVERIDVHGFNLGYVFEGRVSGASMKNAVWSENGFPDQGSGYFKLGAASGFSHEFSLPQNSNMTFDVELMAGIGYAFSELPEYAGYYGGNHTANFLYESFDSFNFSQLSTGPLFRGTGEQQLGVKTATGSIRAGSSYWHINFNAALPLPFAFFPLIPNEEIMSEREGKSVTLKQVLKKSVKQSENMAAATLKFQNSDWDDKKAKHEARRIFSSIQPVVDYLADKANVYSVKPVFMMDCASIGNKAFLDQDIRLGIGGGIQFSIINAKFEVGYMRTVYGLDQDDKDNIFARLFFKTSF